MAPYGRAIPGVAIRAAGVGVEQGGPVVEGNAGDSPVAIRGGGGDREVGGHDRIVRGAGDGNRGGLIAGAEDRRHGQVVERQDVVLGTVVAIIPADVERVASGDGAGGSKAGGDGRAIARGVAIEHGSSRTAFQRGEGEGAAHGHETAAGVVIAEPHAQVVNRG